MELGKKFRRRIEHRAKGRESKCELNRETDSPQTLPLNLVCLLRQREKDHSRRGQQQQKQKLLKIKSARLVQRVLITSAAAGQWPPYVCVCIFSSSSSVYE